MDAASELRAIVEKALNKSNTRAQMAEDVVRAIRLSGTDFLITCRSIHEVIEADTVDGSEGEIGWNVYTKDDDD